MMRPKTSIKDGGESVYRSILWWKIVYVVQFNKFSSVDMSDYMQYYSQSESKVVFNICFPTTWDSMCIVCIIDAVNYSV